MKKINLIISIALFFTSTAFAGEKSVDDALAAAEEQANKIQAE